MRPRAHLIFGSIFALTCYFLLDVVGFNEAFIIWIASWIIIDLDHAIRYSIKTGSFSPLKFWKWSQERHEEWKRIPHHKRRLRQHPIFILHGIEALVVLFLLGLKWDIFNWILIGFIFHLIFDWINLYIENENISYKMSVIWVFWRNCGKKKFLW
jgi:hypothetical protein